MRCRHFNQVDFSEFEVMEKQAGNVAVTLGAHSINCRLYVWGICMCESIIAAVSALSCILTCAGMPVVEYHSVCLVLTLQ